MVIEKGKDTDNEKKKRQRDKQVSGREIVTELFKSYEQKDLVGEINIDDTETSSKVCFLHFV
jgi:hypothetical protein